MSDSGSDGGASIHESQLGLRTADPTMEPKIMAPILKIKAVRRTKTSPARSRSPDGPKRKSRKSPSPKSKPILPFALS